MFKRCSSITPIIVHINAIDIALVSENACLITWPEKICAKQHEQIMRCEKKIQASLAEHIIDIVVSYNSLMIYYNFMSLSSPELINQLSRIITTSIIPLGINTQTGLAHNEIKPLSQTPNITKTITATKEVEIPVYFGDDVAWDIQEVTKALNLSKQAFIDLYTQQRYQAYALGFTPGFCYLGSLNKQLHLPRRKTPRVKIPLGSVAIAEEQTAIYPNESPGGWNIIGKTPLPLYHIKEGRFIPTISVGDSVKFTEITQQAFEELSLTYLQNSHPQNKYSQKSEHTDDR